jgi:acyl carrier protein
MENQDKIANIIAEVLEVDPARVAAGVHFMDDLSADSLTVIEILARLEAAFGITIDQSELARMVTLEAVCSVVRDAHALAA